MGMWCEIEELAVLCVIDAEAGSKGYNQIISHSSATRGQHGN